jgi:hypothetical protein
MPMFVSVRPVAQLTWLSALFAARAHAGIPEDFFVLDPDPVEQVAVGVHLKSDQELIPPFRAGPRDRYRAGVHARFLAADRVLLDLSWQVLADLHPSGERVVGPGDLELGTTVRLPIAEGARDRARQQGRRGPAFGLGWRVKLPNASDEGELGSDETDVVLLACAATDLGPLRGWAGGGLAILGDPLMLAAQDDLVFLQAGLGWDAAASLERAWLPRTDLDLAAALPSPSNPLRAELGWGLAWGRRWSLGVEGAIGLSAAAPGYRIAAVAERRFGGG